MGLVAPGHWQANTAVDTWQSIADAVGVSRDRLWRMNGFTALRTLQHKEVLHVPFEA